MLMMPCIGSTNLAIRWRTWFETPTKGVTSYDILRRAACMLWTGGAWMRLRFRTERSGNAGNWNVLVPAGKEINWDAVSNGEWKQRKANWFNAVMYWRWSVWTAFTSFQATWTHLERWTAEGDSPVEEVREEFSSIQSTVYWILCGNVGGINFQL